MTKLVPVSIFQLSLFYAALLCCSCSRIPLNVNSHIAPRITSQRISTDPLSRQALKPCKSHEECADPLFCIQETGLCEKLLPCDGACSVKINLCNCEMPCSGAFEGFQCFTVTRNGELGPKICANAFDGSIDLIVAEENVSADPLVCDGGAGDNNEGSDDAGGEDDLGASAGSGDSDSSDGTDDSEVSNSADGTEVSVDTEASDATEGSDGVDRPDDGDGDGSDIGDGSETATGSDTATGSETTTGSNGPEKPSTGSTADMPDGSEDTNESEDDTSEAVCVEASMLDNFASHELVFEKHVLAHVLCDMAGSCATKGHIVIYKGEAMMMRSYCDIASCDEKTMMVNSPRYQRGLKVESKSKDMHFTAFAARYATKSEEMVLAAAVRYGL